MRFSAAELAASLEGELVGPDVGVEGASIDSRTIHPGQLYVPIVAARDGHAFVSAAIEAGAPAYLTAPATSREDGGAIGITGSVGKTTTKDLLAACLASTFRVAASERSFNNELGLPLTLLNAPEDVRWAASRS